MLIGSKVYFGFFLVVGSGASLRVYVTVIAALQIIHHIACKLEMGDYDLQ